MQKSVLVVALGGALMGVSLTASAHFQLLYTTNLAVNEGQETHLAMVFTHPFNAYPTMEMGKPEAFYVVSQRGDAEPKKQDLSEYLEAVTWQGLGNSAAAYEAKLPKKVTRSLGDYVFVLQPAPYYEAEEDKYIQQFTKTIMNIGGVPGNWAEPVGLPAEIIPLDRPYANWVGGVFRGVVMADGKPVPFAEIELEYVNHQPDLAGKKFLEPAGIKAPQQSFVIQSLRANAQGEFIIGLPKAGWWGICALGVGSKTQHEGKELSQDAVLWVQATDIQ